MIIPWRRDPLGYHDAISKYIRGIRNYLPQPKDYNMTLDDPEFTERKDKGFAFKIAAEQVSKKELPKTQSKSQPKTKFKFSFTPNEEKSEVNLRGTGITKRALERSVQEQEKTYDKLETAREIPESSMEILPPEKSENKPTVYSGIFPKNEITVPAAPEKPTTAIKPLSQFDIIHQKRQEALKNLKQRTAERIDKQISTKTHVHGQIEKAAFEEERLLRVHEEELGKNITLDEFQQAALTGLSKQKYGCLIGAAGTGKTTVMRQLAEILENTTEIIDLNDAKIETEKSSRRNLHAAICFCSFTGRAVQQMKRALPKKYHSLCATIHKTLGYAPEMVDYYDEKDEEWKEKKIFKPTFTASNKLPFKVCVVDEGGMLGIPLGNELISALPEDCRIILIGDINQLPPVQGRSILGFAMIKWPTFTLEQIHRQAADNPIIANAHRILRGEKPIADKSKFAIIDIPFGATKALEKCVTGGASIIDQLYRKELFDPFRDAIITMANVGILGQVNLNEPLVMKFNPKKIISGIVVNKRHLITAGYNHMHFAVGDKVMILQNDSNRGLTNGMTGVVIDIQANEKFIFDKSEHSISADETLDSELSLADVEMAHDDLKETKENEVVTKSDDDEENESQRPASHIVTVNFGAGDNATTVQFSTAGQLKKITHAYAFTCHKSQGGEYETVVIICHNSMLRMLTREWLYTAVTRAKERVILCCSQKGLSQAIRVQRIKGKTIKEKALQFMELEKLEDVKLPYLPEPEEI